MGTPTRVNVSGSYLFWSRSGRDVHVNGSFNASSGSANAVLLRGFPAPLTGGGVASVVRACAIKSISGGACQLDLTASGELKFEADTLGTGWYMVNFSYTTAG